MKTGAVRDQIGSFLERANGLPIVLFCTFLTYGLIYRIRISLRIAHDEIGANIHLFDLIHHVGEELLFSGMIFLMVWLLRRFWRRKKEVPGKNPIYLALYVILHLFILMAALVYSIHYKLAFALRSGLTLDMLIEVLSSNSVLAMSGETELIDLFFFALIIPLFWFFRLLSLKLRPVFGFLFLALFLTSMVPLFSEQRDRMPFPEFRTNPVFYTASDIAGALGRLLTGLSAEEFSAAQMRSVALIDPGLARPFEDARRGQSQAERAGGKKWNIVFIIMESTGAEYVFSKKYGKQVPMPFLKKLASRSLFWANHYSPTNTSPRSLFSIFSGLYPAPEADIFVTHRDVCIPSLLRFLDPKYHGFLVTPGGLNWYFPFGFFKNDRMRLYGYDQVKVRRLIIEKSDYKNLMNVRDESETVNFFLNKVDRTGGPFLAVYYSHIPHWPYYRMEDLMPKSIQKASTDPVLQKPAEQAGREVAVRTSDRTRWIPDDVNGRASRHRGANALHRYLNNLHLLDTLIHRIHTHLERTGRLQNTILVITGDHGEAFGQHPRNWIHSRGSYNENFRVPMIVYQPELFPTGRIEELTTHVDILPTLLDGMGVAYNPRLLQGESVLRRPFRRRYAFLYGNEQTVSAISREGKKVQYLVKEGGCRFFDLRLDPLERNPQKCLEKERHFTLLRRYKRYQPVILEAYNKALLENTAFNGEKHPFTRRISHRRSDFEPTVTGKRARKHEPKVRKIGGKKIRRLSRRQAPRL